MVRPLLTILLTLFAMGIAKAETGKLEIDIESRHYRPGESFSLTTDSGPLKITGVQVLTEGDRNATLTAYFNGFKANTNTYRYHWQDQWMTFHAPYPKTNTHVELQFGRRDPVIKRLIVHYETKVKTVVKVRVKIKKIYIPVSQMGNKLQELKGAFEDLEEVFRGTGNDGFEKFFHHGVKLLFKARIRAGTHEASDPDRRVGIAADKFLKNFACEAVLDVYAELAYNNLGSSANQIEEAAQLIYQLADLRRYDPKKCSPEMEQILKAL